MLMWNLAGSLVCFAHVAAATSSDQWRSRSIYQILTDRYARSDGNTSSPCNPADRVYCGGTYRGIIDNLNYIQDMGFSAIWISPITQNIDDRTGWGEAYHGYWQKDLYQLNHHFGSEQDLKDLSAALHRHGMYLMVDIVVNHFASSAKPELTNYTAFAPLNDPKMFHSHCTITDYENQTMVEQCWLGDEKVWLVDVDTDHPFVVETFETWIARMVSKFSIDGLRIDTAKHVSKSFWGSFVQAAGVFATGEVLSRSVNYTCAYQTSMQSVLNYPIYYPLLDAFASPKSDLTTLITKHTEIRQTCKDSSLLLNFPSNHDTARLAYQIPNETLRRNVITYLMLSEGIPTLYQGDEQGFTGHSDPENREALWRSNFDNRRPLYGLIRKLNKVRDFMANRDDNFSRSSADLTQVNTNTLLMQRGSNASRIVVLLANTDETQHHIDWKRIGWAAGTHVLDIVGCKEYRVDYDDNRGLELIGGEPMVLIKYEEVLEALVCGSTRRSMAGKSHRNDCKRYQNLI